MASKHLKRTLAITLSLALPAASLAAPLKPRIVGLTDISPITAEPDDFESTIRLLVHADLFEIEGLVASSGWSNSGGRERPDLIRQIIDAYEKDLPNLRKISDQSGHLADESKQALGYWPSPAYLRSRTVLGSARMGFQFVGKDNNFAARMDWAKNGVGNRNPVVIVNGDSGIATIKLTPAPGDSVTLDASASHDPDGDKLKFAWWVLPEAGTYANDVKISGGDSSRATIMLPLDTAGKSIHVICEVTDDVTHNLTSYRRIVLDPTGSTK